MCAAAINKRYYKKRLVSHAGISLGELSRHIGRAKTRAPSYGSEVDLHETFKTQRHFLRRVAAVQAVVATRRYSGNIGPGGMMSKIVPFP